MSDEQVMTVISVSDAEMDAVENAVRPLPPAARGPFLEQVARALVGREIGPGEVHRSAGTAAALPPRGPGRSRRSGGSSPRREGEAV